MEFLMLTLMPAARRLCFFVAPLLIPYALSAAALSPADQSAIEQQQKALLDHTQQQREALRNSTPIRLSPDKSLSAEKGPCFALTQIRLLGSTVLSRDAQKTLTSVPAKGCMSPAGNSATRPRHQSGLSLPRFHYLPRLAAGTGYFRRASAD
jgi:hemolysin activation/secretion protein